MGIFHARDVIIKLMPASTTTIGSNTLSTYFATGSTTLLTAKTCDIDEGEKDFEATMYLGEDSNGFQNQAKIHKPKGPATLTVSFDTDDWQTAAAYLYDTSTTVGSQKRLQDGNSSIREVHALVLGDDGTDTIAFVLANAVAIGPTTKVTGVDGNLETEVKLKCLPKDLKGPEFK